MDSILLNFKDLVLNTYYIREDGIVMKFVGICKTRKYADFEYESGNIFSYTPSEILCWKTK
jgi:hypothetical protein